MTNRMPGAAQVVHDDRAQARLRSVNDRTGNLQRPRVRHSRGDFGPVSASHAGRECREWTRERGRHTTRPALVWVTSPVI
jgi:hypothetical protein